MDAVHIKGTMMASPTIPSPTIPLARSTYRHGDLRRALIEAGTELARRGGPDAVVLRDVSRRGEFPHAGAVSVIVGEPNDLKARDVVIGFEAFEFGDEAIDAFEVGVVEVEPVIIRIEVALKRRQPRKARLAGSCRRHTRADRVPRRIPGLRGEGAASPLPYLAAQRL